MRDIRITEEEISQALIDRHTEEVQARIRVARNLRPDTSPRVW